MYPKKGAAPTDEDVLDPNPEDGAEDIQIPEDEADPAAPKVVDLDDEEEKTKIAKMDRTAQNTAFATMRREAAEAKRERDELKQRIADYEKRQAAQPPAPAYDPKPVSPTGQQREYIGGVPVPQTKAEWDALARQDWQLAVDLRSTIRARAIQEEARTVDTNTRVLEETKQKVLAKHPELADASSEKGKIFLSILDRNPEYLRMSKGPLFAMREMEEAMQEQGYTHEQIFDSKKVTARSETTRVNRAALTGGGRMPAREGRTIQLSKDDLEFCKSQGLDPIDFAKEKAALEVNKKGVQL